MLLLVQGQRQSYLADVGFGGNVLTAPLRLEPGIVQPTSHEARRLTAFAGGFMLEVCVRGEWQRLYRFTLEPQFPPDYEVSSWYLCHHPHSLFRRTLLCARSLPGCRYAVRDAVLNVHRGPVSERKTLANATALRACLENEIGIRLPASLKLDRLLERVTQAPAGEPSADEPS